ncbi:tetratricopeptide repeat protein [Chryseolinea sp. T2]|uniref:tetratricopeptide repeat protein n=1 Tax=Chryseolinea sp. T2 TaxID=3129255 RepID=UPI0030786D7B
MAKKEEHKHELLENPEALKEKLITAETWVESNSKLVVGIGAVIVLVVAGYLGFIWYKNSQNTQAQKEMFQAVYYFEADSLGKALNGDGNNLGFLAIIDDYKFSDAANLANYYAGAAFLKQGKFEAARLYLEDFSSSDLLVQARAYSLIGDTYMEEDKFEDAAKFYSKAANYEPNKYFSPTYLMKEALAYEKLNQNDKAKETYEKIISQYSDSGEYQNARKQKARLETNG